MRTGGGSRNAGRVSELSAQTLYTAARWSKTGGDYFEAEADRRHRALAQTHSGGGGGQWSSMPIRQASPVAPKAYVPPRNFIAEMKWESKINYLSGKQNWYFD